MAHIIKNLSPICTQTVQLVFALIFALALFSCEESEFNPMLQSIDVKLVTLDTMMNEKLSFKPGENFTLALKATNNSDHAITFGSFCNSEILNDPNFSLVYVKANDQLFKIGRCLRDETFFCYALYLPRKIEARQSMLLLGAKWFDNPINEPLPEGKYVSKYQGVIEGKRFRSYTEFSIK